MAEPGDRTPASDATSFANLRRIALDTPGLDRDRWKKTTETLRQELGDKGLKGFKRGGKVKKTGVYKLHAGEKVVTAKKAAQESRDKKLLQKTRYR